MSVAATSGRMIQLRLTMLGWEVSDLIFTRMSRMANVGHTSRFGFPSAFCSGDMLGPKVFLYMKNKHDRRQSSSVGNLIE